MKVNFLKIVSGLANNFEKADATQTTTNSLPYDVSSVMHYGPYVSENDYCFKSFYFFSEFLHGRLGYSDSD